MNKMTYAIAVMLAAGVWTAQAEEDAKPAGPRAERGRPMERLDADGDGKITVAEFTESVTARTKFRFQRLDADQDGKLTAAEYKVIQDRVDKAPKPPEGEGRDRPTFPTFASLDASGDGAVTVEEYVAAMHSKAAERVKGLDKNGDGVLDETELPKGPGPGGPEGGPRRGERPPPPPPPEDAPRT